VWAIVQSSGFRCRITAQYSGRPSGFILPLSMIMIIGKHGVGPSPGSGIVKKSGNSAARRDSLRSRTLWARRKSTAGAGTARSTVSYSGPANRTRRHRPSSPHRTHPAGSRGPVRELEPPRVRARSTPLSASPRGFGCGFRPLLS
jgi:hypothetical protein